MIEIKCVSVYKIQNAFFWVLRIFNTLLLLCWFYALLATAQGNGTQILETIKFLVYTIWLICLKIFFFQYITSQKYVQYPSVMNVLQMFYRHLNGQRRTSASWQEVWLSSQGGPQVDGKRLLTNWVDQWQMWVHSDLHCIESDKPEQDRQCRRQTYMGADIVFWERLQSF